MKNKSRTEITVETERVLIIKRRKGSVLAWCPTCAGRVLMVKVDEAAIDLAALNLGFTRITSPIDGLAGVAQIQIGDLVGPSTAVLTTVSTINPIKVYFQINEQSYLTFWKQFGVSNENAAQQNLELGLILSDGTTFSAKGKFFRMERSQTCATV